MASSVVWKDLSLTQTKALMGLDPQGQKALLAQLFDLGDEKTCTGKNQVLLEFYFNVVKLCMTEGFTEPQLSACFSIMKQVHQKNIESPLYRLDETQAVFKKLILAHSIQRPPYSLEVFALPQIEKISKFAQSSYFQHYKLYKMLFTSGIQLTVVAPEVTLETAGELPPLSVLTAAGPPQPPKIESEPELSEINDAASNASSVHLSELESQPDVFNAGPYVPSPHAQAVMARLPVELQEIVQAAINVQVEEMRDVMSEEFRAKEEAVQERLAGPDTTKTTEKRPSKRK
eukprot:TRINITY_DN41120_c0_g1_i1.p1 TRINITY_DN41120_c0_g1~~TRINITY_DN41120_c0_g1_i1.p1  ORF type:complete len:288 (+),score=63.40 TRINITY_DN41120_c0_g1_i1:148-1011(+)